MSSRDPKHTTGGVCHCLPPLRGSILQTVTSIGSLPLWGMLDSSTATEVIK